MVLIHCGGSHFWSILIDSILVLLLTFSSVQVDPPAADHGALPFVPRTANRATSNWHPGLLGCVAVVGC